MEEMETGLTGHGQELTIGQYRHIGGADQDLWIATAYHL